VWRLAVANQKGGVGKSATTMNLGAALAERGKRVLLVDLDPQGHLTTALGVPEAAPPATLANALLGEWSGALGDLVTPYREGLDVLPTYEDMFLLEQRMYPRTAREWLLDQLLTAFDPAYDFCVIDCPPSLSVLTDNALVAAGRRRGRRKRGAVLIPVQAEDSSLKALRLLLQQISSITQSPMQVDIDIAGLVVNQYDQRRGRIVTSTLEALCDIEGVPVLAVVGDRAVVKEGWRVHEPVIERAPTTAVAKAFRQLAEHVINGGQP
jgi:chromosome partitioning protein